MSYITGTVNDIIVSGLVVPETITGAISATTLIGTTSIQSITGTINIIFITGSISNGTGVMKNIWINATSQSEGNLTLSDSTNWGCRYAFISSIKVVTASTDWDMWLCETSAFNTSLITSRQIAANRNGNFDIDIQREYNSDSTSVYLVYTDNAGSNTSNILIIGTERVH